MISEENAKSYVGCLRFRFLKGPVTLYVASKHMSSGSNGRKLKSSKNTAEVKIAGIYFVLLSRHDM